MGLEWQIIECLKLALQVLRALKTRAFKYWNGLLGGQLKPWALKSREKHRYEVQLGSKFQWGQLKNYSKWSLYFVKFCKKHKLHCSSGIKDKERVHENARRAEATHRAIPSSRYPMQMTPASKPVPASTGRARRSPNTRAVPSTAVSPQDAATWRSRNVKLTH